MIGRICAPLLVEKLRVANLRPPSHWQNPWTAYSRWGACSSVHQLLEMPAGAVDVGCWTWPGVDHLDTRTGCHVAVPRPASQEAHKFVITSTTRKVKVVQGRFTYGTIALLLEIPILLVRAVYEIPSASFGSKPRCDTPFCACLHS